MKLNWYHHSSRLGQLVIERQNVVADIVQHRPQTSTRHSPPVQSNEHVIYCWINWNKRFGLKLLNWAKKNLFFFFSWTENRVVHDQEMADRPTIRSRNVKSYLKLCPADGKKTCCKLHSPTAVCPSDVQFQNGRRYTTWSVAIHWRLTTFLPLLRPVQASTAAPDRALEGGS